MVESVTPGSCGECITDLNVASRLHDECQRANDEGGAYLCRVSGIIASEPCQIAAIEPVNATLQPLTSNSFALFTSVTVSVCVNGVPAV